MKRVLTTAALLAALSATIQAQTPQSLEVCGGSVRYIFDSASAGVMQYADGTTLTVCEKGFDLSSVDRVAVTDATAEDNTVTILYSGATASVTVAGNIARYLDVTVSGADVAVTQGADLATEITYILSGASTDGSFALTGSYKASLLLNGLDLASTKGAPLDIQNGKRIELKLAEDTSNTLADAAGGSQKGAIVCKGHLEFKGKGSLSVAGHTSHAIYAKEYITIKNANITVTSAVKDGLNCAQYFAMESGSLTISGTGDDGIQCSFKDDVDREPEDTGTVTISGGTLNVSSTAAAAKAIKADGDFVMTGGTISASTSGGGVWDATKVKTKASACIGADGTVTISGGSLDLTSTGSGAKGINCDGDFNFAGGDLTIATTGGMFAYVNGVENDNYTGNTDRLDSDAKSSPKGIKADGNVLISGGSISVSTKGNGGEGIESKAELTVTDGSIKVRSYDDGLNSTSHMYIKGGDLDVIAVNNDGLDANGNMYISGGVIRAFGGSSPECGIDVNEEGGYTLYITGGYILGVGGNNSIPTKSGSTQPYVSVSTTVTAGSTISIGTSSETYYTFDIPSDYNPGTSGGWGGPGGSSSRKSVLISVPQLTSGTSYTVKSGTTSTTATARLTGTSSGPGGR